MTSIWTHLEEALLLKLIREHEMATSESSRVAKVDPHQVREGCQIQNTYVRTA